MTPAPFANAARLHVGEPAFVFGTVADTQVQNREAWAVRSLLRNPSADKRIPVTIRPPALDVAARALLSEHLEQQRRRNVSAVFYLGDGSNQGCISELTRTTAGDEGIFPMLAKFREDSGIPVYFVLGNHDFLAAGNTENAAEHAALCGGQANVATKAKLIRMADEFNRGSAGKAGWRYRGSTSAELEDHCEGPAQQEPRQARRRGCYYAATLDAASGGARFRFLLLDTNDYADVSRNRFLRRGGNTPLTTDFEGLRGAMSFTEADDGIENQTSWLRAQGTESRAADRLPDVLVALTHYDVPSLRRTVLVPLSKKTQRLADVFVDEAGPFYRQRAYVVSAHTHTKRTKTASTGITQAGVEIVRLEEVNIGSTTDYPSLSAVFRIAADARGTALTYEPISPSRSGCDKVRTELASSAFPHPFLGQHKGGAAMAVDASRPLLYHAITPQNVGDVFANIDWFIGSSPLRARCLGLMAGSIEAGATPLDELEF